MYVGKGCRCRTKGGGGGEPDGRGSGVLESKRLPGLVYDEKENS